MEWHDEGIILGVRKHGETSAIVSLLTREHGRHMGLVRGGQSRRRQGLLQPGNLVSAGWRARLAEHLGTYTLETGRDFAADVLDDGLRLKALSALTALLESTLAEQDPQPQIYLLSVAMIERLTHASGESEAARLGWLADYVRWELDLLRNIGFGLDLGSCAATGGTEDLIYVSPRSGRAVSAAAGAPWREKLLDLPGFLADPGAVPGSLADIAAGLRLTGHFLGRHQFVAESQRSPAARERLVAALGI
jgi:DNA repair protein RecO (recombination protein O)